MTADPPDSAAANGYVNELLPGTTFPGKEENIPAPKASTPEDPKIPPVTYAGPEIKGNPTTVSLFTTSQLQASPLVPSLCTVINDAFRTQGHHKNGLVLVPLDRLRYDGQLFDELGTAPGTFTFVLSYTGTDQVLATASAKRHYGTEVSVEKDPSLPHKQGNTWTRFGPLEPDGDAWELSTMAVDPSMQRQGLAAYLMRLAEDEIKRKWIEERGRDSGRRLRVMITTIKQVNHAFYSKRGFTMDYEVSYEKGHLDSPCGFSTAHMSREIKLDE
jgi:GNAT superfamily N-acetyltransferase